MLFLWQLKIKINFYIFLNQNRNFILLGMQWVDTKKEL